MDEQHSRESENVERRQQRLQHLYTSTQALLLHESRFIVDRSNNFLSTNSILFAGFLLLATRTDSGGGEWPELLRLGLSAMGVAFCIAQPIIMARTVSALEFWRNTLGLIEADPDFAYPPHPSRPELDSDLDVFAARARAWRSEPTRQGDYNVRPRTFGPRATSLAHRLSPNRYYGSWLAAALGGLWVAGVLWSCVDLFSS